MPSAPFYPPISNFWHNECDLTSSYPLTEAPLNGTIQQFRENEGTDIPIQGAYDRSTNLFQITFQKNGSAHAYTGVYSHAVENSAWYRLVLFPHEGPGHQLILFVCSGGDTDCTNADVNTGLQVRPPPGPTDCMSGIH